MKNKGVFSAALPRFGVAVAAVLFAALGLYLLGDHINQTTVALVLLLAVLTIATFFGRNPALLASFCLRRIGNSRGRCCDIFTRSTASVRMMC